MPAAAVIPAPVAYIKVVAVKKLVVGFLVLQFWSTGFRIGELPGLGVILSECRACPLLGWACLRSGTFTLKKLECLKQAYAFV